MVLFVNPILLKRIDCVDVFSSSLTYKELADDDVLSFFFSVISDFGYGCVPLVRKKNDYSVL